MAGIPSAGPRCTTSANYNPSPATDRFNISSLEQQCLSFPTQGLATSTRKSYASAQREFISFCYQLGKLHSFGSPCPTNKWTLCLLPSWLIPSNIRQLRFTFPLFGHLIFTKGFPTLCRITFIYNVLFVGSNAHRAPPQQTICLSPTASFWWSGDPWTNIPDHCMFWVACTLGYFGFLCAAEFTVPNLASFLPLIHLTVHDIPVDAPSPPLSMHIKIKASKTDPFHKGSDIHSWASIHFALSILWRLISPKETVLHAPRFVFRMVTHFLVAFSTIGYARLWMLPASLGIFQATASTLVPLQLLLVMASRVILSKHGGGQAMPTNYISGPHSETFVSLSLQLSWEVPLLIPTLTCGFWDLGTPLSAAFIRGSFAHPHSYIWFLSWFSWFLVVPHGSSWFLVVPRGSLWFLVVLVVVTKWGLWRGSKQIEGAWLFFK